MIPINHRYVDILDNSNRSILIYLIAFFNFKPLKQSVYACVNDESNESIIINQSYNLLIQYLDKQANGVNDKVNIRIIKKYFGLYRIGSRYSCTTRN